MSTLLDTNEDTRDLQHQCRFLYALVGFVFIIFFIRLWYLQVISGTELRFFSERNISKKTTIAAARGIFFDRDGQVLVDNLPGSEVTITPQFLTNPESTYQALGSVLKISPNEIAADVTKSKRKNGPFEPVRIKEHLTLEEVYQLKLLRIDHPALNINEVILRNYPLKDNGAQLLGFVGEVSKTQLPVLNKRYKEIRFKQGDHIGKRGLEKYLDEDVRGRDGVQHFGVDARGRGAEFLSSDLLESIRRFNAMPLQGRNVQLTIDREVQEAAFKAFSGTGRIGGLVALKNNGEVLAWLSSPSFDPNILSAGTISPQLWSQLINDPFNPLTDKVIQGHAAPGSTLKAIVALAGLQEKVITPQTTVFCPGSMKFGTRLYHCASKGGHGNVSLFQAIERSCNIYFYKLGLALDIDKIAEYAFALGLGKITGIDLHGEIAGRVPTKSWKENLTGEPWQGGENLSNAIGQGFMLATPLQMASAYLAIANDGALYRPFIIKKIFDSQNNVIKEFHPTLIRDVSQKDSPTPINKENFKLVKKGLWQVANGEQGTAHWWKIPGIEIAGKTGTGQLSNLSLDQVYAKCEVKPLNQRHHGWFVAFAPAQNPEIIVAALAEHSCHGSTGAAPVVRDIMKAYFDKYHPDWVKNPKATQAVVKEVPVPPREEGED